MDFQPPLDILRQLRIVKPTGKWDETLRFYRDGLGLRILECFEGHAGYRGCMLGIPGYSYHFEVIEYEGGSPNPCTNPEAAFVFYVESEDEVMHIGERLAALGYFPFDPPNPWWQDHGAVAFLDPENWPVIVIGGSVAIRSDSDQG
jgi:catechol 2,3-dioxygenase-like lactoylglutathione lyase family enzyme